MWNTYNLHENTVGIWHSRIFTGKLKYFLAKYFAVKQTTWKWLKLGSNGEQLL